MAQRPRPRHSRREIIEELLTEYSPLASITPYTEHELKQLFTKAEMARINELLLEMKNAANDNERRERLAVNIDRYSGIVLKLLRRVAGIPI